MLRLKRTGDKSQRRYFDTPCQNPTAAQASVHLCIIMHIGTSKATWCINVVPLTFCSVNNSSPVLFFSAMFAPRE